MLRLERVSKFYSGNGLVSTGFSKVDLEFEIGEFVAITGESGSGKSTLLNVISGLDSYEEGEMYINGEPTSGFSREDLEEYRKKYIGNIFQTFNLINSYTVYQNVELVLLMSGYDKKEIPDKIREIIAKVGLSDYEKTKASKLSGGQKQRVAIARALAKETPIIVADEPTGNLDSKSAAEIIQLLHELSKDKLIVIVTHNYDQVEPYVTRKIAMHDGKVAEDKKIGSEMVQRKVGKEPVRTAKADALTFGSMARLGVRNTFNIPAKFFLLLTVFVFLCAGVIMQYTSVMNMTDMMDGQGYNNFFMDTGKDRILVTKPDRSEFTEADYEKLSAIENVDKIVKNDLMRDLVIDGMDDPEYTNFYSTTRIREVDAYKSQITEGALPQNDREVAYLIPREGYISDYAEELIGKEIFLSNSMSGTQLLDEKVTIVGYGYLTEDQTRELNETTSYYSEGYTCMNEGTLDDIRKASLETYCTQEIDFASTITAGNSAQGIFKLRTSELVPEGQIYIPEDLAALSSYAPVGRELKLTNKSIYFEDTFDFTVGAVYNKDNLAYHLDLDNFDDISGSLFLNPADYNKMFGKGNFQSSVLTKDYKIAAQTAKEITKAGYTAFRVNDGVISYMGGFEIVRDTFFKVLLVGMMAVLFFITYFITKLILKSRNTYFSTIRMLGATKGNCSSLLKTELFVVFNLAFLLCMGVLGLTKMDVIKNAYLQQLVDFLKGTDLIILYVILCVMAILLAMRYARQLFKKTAMNAYKEEV
ncbi:MAG: ABC transporter ATP-binding protein [Emergencia sp.]